MIEIKKESIKDIKEEMLPLLVLHKEEVAPYDFLELNPAWDLYDAGEDAGSFVVYTVRDDGVLVGYLAYLINQSLHYQDERFAYADVIFLQDAYRHSYTANDLLTYAEADLTDNYGVTMMLLHMKVKAPFETLALCQDYDKMEYVYTKYVGGIE